MGTWRLTVARNLIIDDWRWRRLRPEFLVRGPPVSDDHWNDVDAALQSRLVSDALHRLSAEHRDVLLECFYRGCSIAEVAVALDVSEAAVKLRCHDALRTLRLVLAELGGSTYARSRPIAEDGNMRDD